MTQDPGLSLSSETPCPRRDSLSNVFKGLTGDVVSSPFTHRLHCKWVSQVVQTGKNLPAVLETWVQSLGLKDTLQKEMATYSSTFAWKIPWMEEPGRLHSMGLQSWTQLSNFTASLILTLYQLLLLKLFIVFYTSQDAFACLISTNFHNILMRYIA